MFDIGDKVKVKVTVGLFGQKAIYSGTVIVNDEEWLDIRYQKEIRYMVLLDREVKVGFTEDEAISSVPTEYKVEGKRYVYALENELTLNVTETEGAVKEKSVSYEYLIEEVDKMTSLEMELKLIDEDIEKLKINSFALVGIEFDGDVKSSYNKYKPSYFLNTLKTIRETKRLECMKQRKKIESFIK